MWLPAAIRYGIPYETFWKLNPRIMSIYQDAYNKRLQEKYEDLDYAAWLNGMYVMNAIGSAFNKNSKYPEAPISKSKEQKTLTPEEKFKLWVLEYNKKYDENMAPESAD